ncbi:MAG: beta-mannanase [Chloroflexi bacterium]|nr:beta-mannanase [Chloroflexota bacterium]
MTPSQSGVALGIYEPSLPQDFSKLDSYEQRTGRQLSIVHWYAQWGGWKSAFDVSDLEAVAARGSIPLITWEPWTGVPQSPPDPNWSLRASVLSGRSDAYIESWARGLAAYGGPVLLRFAHEMNNQPVYPWAVGNNDNTASDYVAAWDYVRATFARFHADNVQWVWNPNTMGDATPASYVATYQSLYPGDDAVDWLGLDIFNTGPNLDWGRPRWQTFGQALAAPYAAVTSVSDKPLILPEVGSTETGGSKAAWISQALGSELPQFPRVRALVWFDVNKEQPWNLDSSGPALQAWLNGLSQSG